MPSANSKTVHVIQDEDSGTEGTQVARRARSSVQSGSNVARSAAKANRKYRKRMMQNLQSGSRRARRTRKAREEKVSGTTLLVPPELVRLRQSLLYRELIPKSICREELDRVCSIILYSSTSVRTS